MVQEDKRMIHVQVAPFRQGVQPLELPEGATLQDALTRTNQPFSASSVRVGGKSATPDIPLRDGQIITTAIPKIVVG